MVDVVMKNKSGQAYDPQLNVCVVVYGSKGCNNDLPLKDVWDRLYSVIHNGYKHFNAPLIIDNPEERLNPATKHYVDDATIKIYMV